MCLYFFTSDTNYFRDIYFLLHKYDFNNQNMYPWFTKFLKYNYFWISDAWETCGRRKEAECTSDLNTHNVCPIYLILFLYFATTKKKITDFVSKISSFVTISQDLTVIWRTDRNFHVCTWKIIIHIVGTRISSGRESGNPVAGRILLLFFFKFSLNLNHLWKTFKSNSNIHF